ncbi:MAG TPA: D-glycero-beta-D-manno-heptose-7-phosphate kinase [Candidatus Omnitrophota bacterium]|nr:D-glycero-beta-D-manno-heptose-7-phosphate kinase [Candidatus Omnitrophota bacterium]MDD4940369.1 D-glycero-beta-D-manno-heptose-7-phosphate kinase [Candidatus Omnitrophota bacterium]HNQ51518.1 D-glycero-beta-D-manno-heptose-7-phosphate kinase [Candidatus Omnitrophota bacterium]HQO37985.1 D-glycero-beta-D-manno-heptose-7-phosphate kinase [Candidatus Omnitrophota bacterium]HQQ05598.1 D-glycero-beta-D-manno-heptose-7-phosphate kinase [Candidatus Omnitrophota bacterium]
MKQYISYISRFSRARVLVIGDLILDEYVQGSVERISPEAPVPVVWAKERTFVPGGAANVASNLRALGARVALAGVVGRDHYRDIMLSELRARGIDTAAVIEEKGRQTTLKTRLFASHQQIVRVDWEHVGPILKATEKKLDAYVAAALKRFDAVIIEDYGKGVFTNALLSRIIARARSLGTIITVDPKEDNFESYGGVTAITPNRKETQNAIRYLKMKDTNNAFKIYHDELERDADIRKAGYAILQHLGLESLLVTLGENGMWLFEKGRDEHIPTVAQEVFDVSGAGDTTIATFTLALCAGMPRHAAAVAANVAAGIVVGKLGTATVTREELIERMRA